MLDVIALHAETAGSGTNVPLSSAGSTGGEQDDAMMRDAKPRSLGSTWMIAIRTILLVSVLFLLMLLPYLPGRYDASAATLSLLAQIASLASLLLVPVGLAWIVDRRRSRLWYTLTLALLGLICLMTAIAAGSANQLAMGMMIGIGVITFLLRTYRRTREAPESVVDRTNPLPFLLVLVPILLVTFRYMALPRAAEWSRDRAIQHSAPLTAEIESFHSRRGHYPVSLHSLNRDVPTGVVGIERFLYEPHGEGYNLFFVRPSIELDAWEVVLFNPRDEHRFTSHELDLLQYDGEQLDLRRGDRRRTPLPQPHWVTILFD